jgi:hypothetical protein
MGELNRSAQPARATALFPAKVRHFDDPQGMEREFYKQLKAQEDGINKMTVGEYLQNRETLQNLTNQYGHEKARDILTSSGKAQEAARKKLQKKIQDSIEASLAKKDIFGEEAEKIAAEKAKEQMSQLAALHDPDLIAGGTDTISKVGNKNVNSSLGSQWAKDGRVDGMDSAAKKALTESGPNTKMNITLERCK